jgi:hypothetical protein
MAINPLNRKLDRKGNPIVSKAELDKSGMSLRDFLNAERGLTRRGSAGTKAPMLEERASTVDGPATATAREVASLMPSPAKPADRSREVTARELAENFNPTPSTMPRSRGMSSSSAEDKSDFMPGGMKKGGMTASKRGDGCAVKGKTRGTMVTMKGGGYAR